MLTHPTLDQLRHMKLDGMAFRGLSRPHWGHGPPSPFIDLQTQDTTADLSHAEWLGLLVDRAVASRNTRRFQTRMRAARLRHIGPPSKMPTSAHRANWTGPCSGNSPPDAGSVMPAT